MMKHRISTAIVLILAVLLTLSVRAQEPGTETDHKIPLFVSILPQADFVSRIGGDYVDVNVLVGQGQSPAIYEPTPKQMAKLEKSRIYFRIGVPFETQFLKKISGIDRNLRIVDTRKGIKLRYFSEEVAARGGKHSHTKTVPDPHIWLDPKRVKIQAQTICDALCREDPAHADIFKKNLASFTRDLERVDVKIADALAPLKGEKFYVFHPAFGYFGESYGLRQVAIETEGKEPGPKQLAKIVDMARKDKVKVIFVEPQFSSKSAEAIAHAIGAKVVAMDPLSKDYLKNLEKMAETIKTYE